MPGLPAIEIENLWKTYRVHAPGAAPRRIFAPKADFHALSDVSFTVPEGAVLGIVGSNGAGKSTLLKILSRVTDPSRGRVVLRGRTASILEIGTGFHPELTGLENVYLNGAVHGLSRRDIRARLPAILEFAEIGDWVHEPAKHYSSGMYLRLAFSVAAHLDPDIMIVDELLAVGDQQFRERCFGRMRQVAGEGRTVVLVSHDAPAVTALCTMAAFLQKGRLVMTGQPEEVVEAYHSSAHVGGGVVHLNTHAVELEGVSGHYAPVGVGEAALELEASIRTLVSVSGLRVDASVTHAAGHSVVHIQGSIRGKPLLDLRAGGRARWRLSCRVPELRPGNYTCGISIQDGDRNIVLQMSGIRLCTVHPSSQTPELSSPSFHAVQVPPHEAKWLL